MVSVCNANALDVDGDGVLLGGLGWRGALELENGESLGCFFNQESAQELVTYRADLEV